MLDQKCLYNNTDTLGILTNTCKMHICEHLYISKLTNSMEQSPS